MGIDGGITLEEKQWEYCMLAIKEWKRSKVGGREGWTHDCWVVYQGPAYTKIHQLSELDKEIFDFNPFSRAMGLLGAAGWELITMQHGYGPDNSLRLDNKIAYFKRPVVEGRAVEEPPLVL